MREVVLVGVRCVAAPAFFLFLLLCWRSLRCVPAFVFFLLLCWRSLRCAPAFSPFPPASLALVALRACGLAGADEVGVRSPASSRRGLLLVR